MNYFTFITVLIAISLISKQNQAYGIETKLKEYFESESTKAFQEVWEKQQKSFENTLRLGLRDHYDRPAMNIYVNKAMGSHLLGQGFYVSDNAVSLLTRNMRLRELPKISLPSVQFGLANNFLQLDAGLGKMFIEAEYWVFRNKSDILFNAPQYPLEHSPFINQQVQTVGQMAIVAEECRIVGDAISTLSGQSVNIGHNSFKVDDCKFYVEVFTEGAGSPPVIAPYFSQQQTLQLQRLISKPIVEELEPKLQGALYSYVNTSAIFGKDLANFRHHQEKIFKQTSAYFAKFIRHLNRLTIESNQGRMELPDFRLSWDDPFCPHGGVSSVLLSKMVLNGLDTAYSPLQGGPYKMPYVKMIEVIKFNSMTVRGKIAYENETYQGEYNFAVELREFEVNLRLSIDVVADQSEDGVKMLKPSKAMQNKFEVDSWSSMEFSILDLNFYPKEHVYSHSMVAGYLNNEIPKCLVRHMSDVLPKAILQTETDANEGKGDLLVDIPEGDSIFDKEKTNQSNDPDELENEKGDGIGINPENEDLDNKFQKRDEENDNAGNEQENRDQEVENDEIETENGDKKNEDVNSDLKNENRDDNIEYSNNDDGINEVSDDAAAFNGITQPSV